MRYALLADLHGHPKALRRILAAASAAGVDEVVCVGDYLEAKVPWRRHDPSRYWPRDVVVDDEPALWSRLARLRLVLGNQELRIRELLRPDQVPAELAPLLDAPEWDRVHALVVMHGHQISWTLGISAAPAQLLFPDPGKVPRVGVVVVGHTHQRALFEIDRSGPTVRSIPVEPGRPIPLPAAPPARVARVARVAQASAGAAPAAADQARGAVPDEDVPRTAVINIGPARGRPSEWLLYDTVRNEVSFQEAG